MPKKDSYFPFDEKEISWLCHRDSQLKAVISHMEKPKRKLLPDLFSGLIFYIIHNRFRQKLPKQNGHVSNKSIEEQYAQYLKELPYIGGKKSIHNGEGGTYDCIFLFALYEALNHKPTMQDIYDLNCSVFLPSFEKLKKWKFIDANHALILRIIYFVFRVAAWIGRKDRKTETGFIMCVEPFVKTEGIHYRFDRCPIAEFAKAHHLLHLMPSLCNGDYPAMEDLHATLIRKNTCANGDVCDYWIVGDKSEIAKTHPRKTDDAEYWYNKNL